MKPGVRCCTALLLAITLAGCTSIARVEGEQVLNGRLSVQTGEVWNKVSLARSAQPYEVWTQEGLWLDHLRLWSGIRPGEVLHRRGGGSLVSGSRAPRLPTFHAGLAPDQLVNLFENVYSADGSIVTMTRVEPASFAGQPGVHFEFAVVRMADGLPLRGEGWAAVRNDELYAATFVAPRLSFYARLRPQAEAVVRSARIRD